MNDIRFLGADLDKTYVLEAKKRITQAIKGEINYRADKPVFDYKDSNLSIFPAGYKGTTKK